MGWFTKKQKKADKKISKEFDMILADLNDLARLFKLLHSKSLLAFEQNMHKKKTLEDLKAERLLFEKQYDVFYKLKHKTDLLIDEALRLIKNESVTTESDRVRMKENLEIPEPPALASVSSPKHDKHKGTSIKKKRKSSARKTKKKATKKKVAKKKPAKKKATKKQSTRRSNKKSGKKNAAKKNSVNKKKKKKSSKKRKK